MIKIQLRLIRLLLRKYLLKTIFSIQVEKITIQHTECSLHTFKI